LDEEYTDRDGPAVVSEGPDDEPHRDEVEEPEVAQYFRWLNANPAIWS